MNSAIHVPTLCLPLVSRARADAHRIWVDHRGRCPCNPAVLMDMVGLSAAPLPYYMAVGPNPREF